MRAEQRQALLNDVLLVLFGHLCLALLDELYDPTRIQIHHKANAAPILGQVFDSQTQTPRPGWPKRQPISARRKKLVGQVGAEGFVVEAKVLDVDSGLRHTSTPTRLESIDWPAGITFWHPATHRTSAQPLVLKEAETR